MYFKKLEIFGFKSFADKTILNFEPGITAIVGPNGCGKSNVFDSIRWVLGEQSVKELRGADMEDVIFNGTEKKPSLGFAEVNLVLANESRALPMEHDEVIITRRLFRSGESEYLLNKNLVRLRDIQELLMGTGIGAEAYSLIQQGKVDLIVNARPEDRRVVFDEAAGITKYKAKRREALSKLKSTEDNLLRVNDIIIELKRQITSLERQASKAKKYQEEFEKLKNYEIELARYEIEHCQQKQQHFKENLKELEEKKASLVLKKQEAEILLNDETQNLEDLEQKLGDVRAEEIKIEGQVNLSQRQIGFNEERIQTLSEQDRRLHEQKEQLIERCRLEQEKVEVIKKDVVFLEENIQKAEAQLQINQEGLKELEKLIKESREVIQKDEERTLNLTSNQVSIRNEVTEIMKEVQGALARKRRLQLENEKVVGEKGTVDQKLQNLEGQVEEVKKRVEELKQKKSERLQTIEDLQSRYNVLTERIDQLEKKKLFFISQKEFIEKLHVQYQEMPDPVIEGRLSTGAAPLAHQTGIIGKIKEVHNRGSSYEIVCETKFVELDLKQISAKIEEIAQEITGLAQEESILASQLQEQKNILREIEEKTQDEETTRSVLEAQKNDIFQEIKKLSEELNLVYSELEEVKESLIILKKKEDELNYRLDTITQDISWCQNDIKDKQALISVKLQDKEETTVIIAQLQTAIQAEKDKLKVQQDNERMFSEALDNWLDEIKSIEDELKTHVLKQEQYVQETAVLKRNIEEDQIRKEFLKKVLTEHEIKKSAIVEKLNVIRNSLTSLEDNIEDLRQNIHAQQMSEQELGFNEKGIKDRLFQTYKIDLDQIDQMASAQAAEFASVDTAVKTLNLEELNTEIERLKKRCESFGGVNLMAIEEFEELKERFNFLTKQQSDLLEAKSQLMSTITKINRTTREMFLETFTKVSEEFRVYFRTLFRGGEARLILNDAEDILESGIEIEARPPGKKLQNISLLSGGEKTLTAIALIFGIFKVNPSPFCVLDEIDAALDEANVDRFAYLLKEFSKIAQFIIITHNKKTIANSNVLYGITMEETGVSRVVSVKFSDEKTRELEEEPAPA